jgi:hypothetical protein
MTSLRIACASQVVRGCQLRRPADAELIAGRPADVELIAGRAADAELIAGRTADVELAAGRATGGDGER